MNQELLEKCKNADLLKEVAKGKEVVWINENLEKTEDAMAKINITMADIDDAEARLARFAPFLMKKFPETIPTNGLIESPLTYIPNMQKKLEEHYDTKIPGKMFLKQDSHLAISGSVKARGGIYEVLKHAEDLALEHGMLRKDDDYSVFASDEFKEFFSKFKNSGWLHRQSGYVYRYHECGSGLPCNRTYVRRCKAVEERPASPERCRGCGICG